MTDLAKTHNVAAELQRCRQESDAAREVASRIDRSNVLRFSLVRQILWGTLQGKSFGPVKAWSGAGQDGVTAKDVMYPNWSPHRKADSKSGVRGGALVPGWWIVLPQTLAHDQQSSYVRWGGAPTGNSLRIVPYQVDGSYASGQRNSFYIHGTGGKGSDGCLLVSPGDRDVLVRRIVRAGGAWLHAYVSGIEMNEALERSNAMRSVA